DLPVAYILPVRAWPGLASCLSTCCDAVSSRLPVQGVLRPLLPAPRIGNKSGATLKRADQPRRAGLYPCGSP
ncbi:hypothetical protein EI94DRAFT_1746238, partial [Lactarius quietus]